MSKRVGPTIPPISAAPNTDHTGLYLIFCHTSKMLGLSYSEDCVSIISIVSSGFTSPCVCPEEGLTHFRGSISDCHCLTSYTFSDRAFAASVCTVLEFSPWLSHTSSPLSLIKHYLQRIWHILIHQVFEFLLAQSVWISFLPRVLVEGFDDVLHGFFHLWLLRLFTFSLYLNPWESNLEGREKTVKHMGSILYPLSS